MLGERNILRRGAEGAAVALAVKEPDPLTDAKPGDAVTNLVDNPRAVTVGYDARIFNRAVAAGAAADIGGINAGGFQPDANLASPGRRCRHVAKCQDIARRTGSLIPDRLHSVPGHAPPSSRMF